MPVHFSDREMQRAWRQNFQAYDRTEPKQRTNAHRLLLFYSIECGLKAMLMKNEAACCTDVCAKVIKCGHNINDLIDALYAGHNLKIPHKIMIKAGGSSSRRSVNSEEINQMWRYGGEATHTQNGQGDLVDLSDEALEKQLLKISVWIREALR